MGTDFSAMAEALDTTWTPEQQAIFEHIKGMDPGSALAIEARAGTGKTTTAIEGLHYTRRPGEKNSALILAFNRATGKELERRTPPHVKGSTFHALALGLLGKEPRKGYIWGVAKTVIKSYKLRHPAVQLVGLAKNLGVGLVLQDDPAVWRKMLADYGIRYQKRFRPAQVVDAARKLFHATLKSRDIDFDDMLYLVARDGVGKGFKPLDWLMVDEFQDTNPVQLLMLDKIREASDGRTRLVLIGDPKQAIYGWRGAGVSSFAQGVERYNADVLPLTTSWRSDVAIIESAQEVVPDIRARDGAAEGSVEEMWGRDFELDYVADGDVILCRNNAPIFELALQAIREGRTISVAGKDLAGKILRSYTNIFGTPGWRNEQDPNNKVFFAREIVRIEAEYADRPMAKAIYLDEVKSAQALWYVIKERTVGEEGRWRTLQDFMDAAEDVLARVFAAPGSGKGIVLSTIHMSKGLEWDTVWYYMPELIPSKGALALGGWHVLQEDNLDYVARTRAKHRLVFVKGSATKTDDDPGG